MNYLGKAALSRIAQQGVEREIRGVLFDGGYNLRNAWSVMDEVEIGKNYLSDLVTRLKGNVGRALIL